MAPVPVGRNAAGGLNFQYQPVQIDDALLTDIARMTGGRYFRARDAAALQNIYAVIDRMERTPVRTTTVVRYSELYRWPLALGIIALFAELALDRVEGAASVTTHPALHPVAVGFAARDRSADRDSVAGPMGTPRARGATRSGSARRP